MWYARLCMWLEPSASRGCLSHIQVHFPSLVLQETRQRTVQTIQEFPVGCSEAKWQTQIHKYTTPGHRRHTHTYNQSHPRLHQVTPTPTPSQNLPYPQSHPHLHPVTPTPTPSHTTPTSSHTHTYIQSHPHLHPVTPSPTPSHTHTHMQNHTQAHTLQLADAGLKHVLSPLSVQVGTGLPDSARVL